MIVRSIALRFTNYGKIQFNSYNDVFSHFLSLFCLLRCCWGWPKYIHSPAIERENSFNELSYFLNTHCIEVYLKCLSRIRSDQIRSERDAADDGWCNRIRSTISWSMLNIIFHNFFPSTFYYYYSKHYKSLIIKWNECSAAVARYCECEPVNLKTRESKNVARSWVVDDRIQGISISFGCIDRDYRELFSYSTIPLYRYSFIYLFKAISACKFETRLMNWFGFKFSQCLVSPTSA